MIEEQNKSAANAKPEKIPQPTYWPLMTAVSLLFLSWGLLTTWIICVAGAIGFFISLAGWIKDLIYERRTEE